MKNLPKCLVFFILLAICNQSPAQSSDFTIAQIPKWVKQLNPKQEIPDKNRATAAGSYYLLLNRQEDVTREQAFWHFAVNILNTEGLQEVADFSVDFDPSYQKLAFHKIDVIRGKEVINQLDDHVIKIVQRETSMERHIYDGRLTAVINLTDIRVGDIIDYAYSVTGYNPVYEGFYSDTIYLQYSVPIEQIYIRLITPLERKFEFKYLRGAPKPRHQQSSDSDVYIWERHDVPLILYDVNTPSWFDPYPRVAVSNYPSWGSLVEWGLNLFSLSEQERNRLRANVKGLIAHPTIDSTIVRAIRFTQDKVRYLGFVNGLNSHKPHPPTKVLNQRFGDCKDKSFLLSEILKLSGIDAAPLLVHSTNGYSLADGLPSPRRFDHCVVQFALDGRAHFVDPTLGNQGGDLVHNYFPNYHKGLLIKEGQKALLDLPLSNYTSTKATEVFTLDEVGAGASLHVATTYTGAAADNQREYFASSNLEEVQKAFVDFYSRLYPKIRVDKQIQVDDQRWGANTFSVEEFYVLDSLWVQSESDDWVLLCEFYPLSLQNYISVPQSSARSMPYLVGFPVDVEHQTIIKLPEEWTVESETKNIDAESFSYTSSVSYEDDTISIVHRYKTLQEYVNPEAVESFIQKHNSIIDNLSFALTYNRNLATDGFKFSWSAALIAIITVIVSAMFAIRIFHSYDIPVSSDAAEPEAIAGWLILVGLGLCMTPLKVLFSIFGSSEYFNSLIWDNLIDINASTRHLLTGLLMLVELIYNFAYLVFSVLLLFLFFGKRTIFPRFAIGFYAVTLIVISVDTTLAFQLNPDVYSGAERQDSYKEIAQAFGSAVIWIPYFILSKRVRETFVVKSKRNRGQKPTE